MRILFCTTPGHGHVLPMLPTAWALRSAGHEVLFTTSGPAGPVTGAGLHVVDVAPGLDVGAIFGRHFASFSGYADAQRSTPRVDFEPFVPVFAEISDAMADGTLEVARRWRPDLVLHTNEQGTGPLVGAALGIPSVVHGYAFATPMSATLAVGEHMAATYTRHGAGAYKAPAAQLDLAPPSMRVDVDRPAAPVWPMRTVPYNGGAALEPWLTRRPERPRIVMTLGTANREQDNIRVLARLVELAAGLPVEVVLLLGNLDGGSLAPLPDNVRAYGWVPLHVLLDTCAGLVHHGGAGTALACLAAAVPQLILAQSGDQFLNGAVVRDRGAGIFLDSDEVDADTLHRLIADEGIAAAARQVSAEIAALPSPAEIAVRLTDLVHGEGR
ncbi:salmochelin biosynthesis C-glycosyltransferase IroB [Dactylosporangium fulvum]|uniref:DUF1205 domain-containing protein n=1 Tax=Dactylosporangium fulvum TaxID=53359 RepID=A0ABY5W7W2_9ACTN|nr:nucleotide disphospho-sugar-binding domain-containing protein [Dactylosporangium fulvum]UWP86118.1 DUF1205 domain-containing protein [Dactylosporangium fulvum]